MPLLFLLFFIFPVVVYCLLLLLLFIPSVMRLSERFSICICFSCCFCAGNFKS